MRTTIDVGIDLGTTNSAIAVQRGAATTVLRDAEGRALLPSVVHLGPGGEISVGAAAIARLADDPENVQGEFKRLMGTDERLRFPGPALARTPEELSAEILRTLAAHAADVLSDGPLRGAVITVPAMFQVPQSQATARAAEIAGIEHAPLLQEPIAAAIAHAGVAAASSGYWLVYDLGGGTFDVSIVRARRGRLQIVDHDGDNHLGGKDLDRDLVREAATAVRAAGRLGAFSRRNVELSGAFALLRAEAERVRIALSTETSATFHVPNLARDAGGEPVDVRFDVTRDELETLIAPLVRRSVRLCERILARNRVGGKELSGLVLVGGPTRTPLVERLLRETLSVELGEQSDPMTLVARGAALFASTQELPRALRRSSAAGVVRIEPKHPSMTTDLEPLYAATLIDADSGDSDPDLRLQVIGIEGDFDSTPLPAVAPGTFVVPLRLQPQRLNHFEVRLSRGERPVAVEPARFNILHGRSLDAPPLPQSVGVMCADNTVMWYLRKGTPLPARSTVTHATTIPLARGSTGEALNVPVVQGESEAADRNDVIGVLHIHAEAIGRDLPAGAKVEVTILVDEFSHTSVRAYVPNLGQWFEDVARFEMAAQDGEDVARALDDQRDRLKELEDAANGLDAESSGEIDERIRRIETLLDDGDRDALDSAGSMVRGVMKELDEVSSGRQEETLRASFAKVAADTRDLVRTEGKREEREELAALEAEFEAAAEVGDWDEAEAKMREARNLYFRVALRIPAFWVAMLLDLQRRFGALGQHADAREAAAAAARGRQGASIGTMARAFQELVARLPETAREGVPDPAIVSHVL